MEIIGRSLTPEEKEQIRAPFCKNQGMDWDLRKIAEYVQHGFEASAADADIRMEIENGIRSLGKAARHD